AQQLLSNYAWPGNVRQLKNIAEQISVLEKERLIDAQTLAEYLPVDQRSTLPVHVAGGTKDDFSERDLLYKVLFDMKKDMVELKKLVVEIIQNGVNSRIVEDHSPYINKLYRELDSPTPEQLAPPSTLTIHHPQNVKNEDFHYHTQEAEEVEEESLSLIEKESDLIKKALKKHKGKRKSAA